MGAIVIQTIRVEDRVFFLLSMICVGKTLWIVSPCTKSLKGLASVESGWRGGILPASAQETLVRPFCVFPVTYFHRITISLT